MHGTLSDAGSITKRPVSGVAIQIRSLGIDRYFINLYLGNGRKIEVTFEICLYFTCGGPFENTLYFAVPSQRFPFLSSAI